MKIIPPTPSKESCDRSNGPTPPAATSDVNHVSFGSNGSSKSSPQLDLSYYPPDVTTRVRFLEDSEGFNFDALLSSQEPSLMGRRPLETNIILEDGFAALERIFTDLSQSTAMSVQQVINAFLKSHGRVVHNINYWNTYANYFKDHMQQELARLKGLGEGAAADSSKGKGKEIPVEAQGTPSECAGTL